MTTTSEHSAATLTRPGALTRSITVIVRPDVGLRVAAAGITSVGSAEAREFAAALASAGLASAPLFGANEKQLATMARAPAEETDVDIPDLSGFYRVTGPTGIDLEAAAAALRQLDFVAAAYVAPVAELPVMMDLRRPVLAGPAPTLTPDFTAQQGYLNAAPAGVDARYAWSLPGGGGAGVRILDVEGAWRFGHEDLQQSTGGLIRGPETINQVFIDHGTAVVGVMSADRGTRGVTGISPEAKMLWISEFGQGGLAEAIRIAADALGRGDIILIEAHSPSPIANFTAVAAGTPTVGYIPVEWWEENFQAIRYATARGILVVEAGGNGSQDLDDPIYDKRPAFFADSWTNPFRRGGRDSGAIVVGAGAPPSGHFGADRSRLVFSNYGSIIDAQGWGREVVTTGYGDLQGDPSQDRWYTEVFSGTSSASPIVAGALACAQGHLRSQFDREQLTPLAARQLLRTTGSPQQDAPGAPVSQRIGNRPALGEMLIGPSHLRHHGRRGGGRGSAVRRPAVVVPAPRSGRWHGFVGRGPARPRQWMGPSYGRSRWRRRDLHDRK
jgi:hypothetical protein